jgi:hypothetical protein
MEVMVTGHNFESILPKDIRHADILKMAYLCQVSDTGSPELLVFIYNLGHLLDLLLVTFCMGSFQGLFQPTNHQQAFQTVRY